MQSQAVAWEGYDGVKNFIVRIYGRTEHGRSISVATPFEPYFFIKARAKHSIKVFKMELAKYGRVTEERAKDLIGFRNGLEERFFKVTCPTLKDMKICAAVVSTGKCRGLEEHNETVYGLEKQPFKVYESNIDPVLRFMHLTGIRSTGWFTVFAHEPDDLTTCDVGYFVSDWKTLKPVERDDIAPLKIMSFDIECYSSTGQFPKANIPEDVVFQIGMTTKTYGKEGFERKCLCYKQTTGYDSYNSEKELLEAFEQYIQKCDPDIVTGWNIFGFDLEFLQQRCVFHGLNPVWGRYKDSEIELVEKKLSSNALGDNLLKMVPMRGRYVFDLFQDVKREHKLESYSLNNVSKHFLKDQKNDMPVREIFRRFETGQGLDAVADYCIQDTVLPHKLMEKLCQLQNLIEMAKACWVPLSFLSERGQQIKVFSQMAYKARQLGFIIPVYKAPLVQIESDYQGATVLDAQTGAYYTPITALDFASLYPSIMCAHNLCYSSLVLDPQFDNLEGVEYERFQVGDKVYTFAQNVPSLLPVILSDLKAYRKKAKKLMAQHEGTPMESVYNGQQLAYKISMNSIYGFTGASKGMLPCVAIASTVTCRGRQMIEETKNYVEAHFPGAQVRYGDTDSVMVEFDVQGRKGQEAIDYSWQLGEQAAEQCTKLFKAPNDLELEKVYCPYFLYSKKRYAAKMYEGKHQPDGSTKVVFKKIDVKGLQVVRRDSCPYVRETLKKLLEMILESDDPRPPVDFVKEACKKLKAGDVPMDKLLLSKQLASDYKAKMPHVEVRDKIRKRAPGSEPQQGDRVPFVIVQSSKKAKMFEKAEDPAYVQENNIPIDYEYYFTNQLKKPVCDLLEPLIGKNVDKVLFPPKQKCLTDYFK
jgi:DNA polymerase delta subunit 1